MSPTESSVQTSALSLPRRLARWSTIVAFSTLVYGGLVLGYTWWNAATSDRMPDDIAYYQRTGNGPWDHAADLKVLLDHAMLALMYAAAFSLLAVILRPAPVTVSFLAVSLVSFAVIMATHLWLID